MPRRARPIPAGSTLLQVEAVLVVRCRREGLEANDSTSFTSITSERTASPPTPYGAPTTALRQGDPAHHQDKRPTGPWRQDGRSRARDDALALHRQRVARHPGLPSEALPRGGVWTYAGVPQEDEPQA